MRKCSFRGALTRREHRLVRCPRSPRALEREHALLCALSLAVPVLLAIGCNGPGDAGRRGASEASTRPVAANADLGRFDRIPESAVHPLGMQLIATVRLGNSAANTPAAVDRLKMSSNRIYVLDEPGRAVRAYDRRGAPIFTLPTGRTGARQLDTPVGLALRGDTLLLVDIDPRRGLSVVASSGVILRQVPLEVGSTTVGVAPAGERTAVATIVASADISSGRGRLIHVVNDSGVSVASGCTPDPLYVTSVRRAGLFAMFRFTGVTASDGRLYCRQPVTPAIQVLGSRGELVSIIRAAPPFYRRGTDVPQSSNQVVVERFRSTWWEHQYFFPLRGGFVSVYSKYDTSAADSRYRLFGCTSAGTPDDCFAADAPGVPLDLIAPDTLVVSRPLSRVGGIQELAIYELAP